MVEVGGVVVGMVGFESDRGREELLVGRSI